jgi:ADP-ribosylglycohydrolase
MASPYQVYLSTFDEAKRRASLTSCSTIKYWLENEVEPENDS